MRVENARIESTHLGTDDHGGITFWLHLDYGSSAQGFGGYGLCSDRRPPTVFPAISILGILDTVGVSKWEDLPGRYVRAEIDGGLVRGIGHITKDKWFRPAEAFAPYEDEEYRIAQLHRLAEAAEGVLESYVRAKGEEGVATDYTVRRLRELLAKAKEVTP